jgi:3-hydroxybutyryl-CoA dehydrogenase
MIMEAERSASNQRMSVERVLIVGAGTMGNGIAQVVAEAGIEATLHDADPGNLAHGIEAVEARWKRAIAAGRRDELDVSSFLQKIQPGDLSAAADADLIIEAIVEKVAAKTELLRELAQIAKPGALIASNTSSISITALGRVSGRPERFVGLHFFNPVPRLPLVEVVRGLDTSDVTIADSRAFVARIDKTPIVVNDAPGFVANRILLPMINEAIFALQDGVAPAESIDEIMKLGMSHPLGPLALADLIGLDICLDILETLHCDFGDDKYRPAPLLRRMVAGGKLGRKSGQGFYSYANQ